jgi:hypothetical protein
MPYFKSPDNSLHVIEHEFAHLLPADCVPITEEEADAIRAANTPSLIVPQSVTRFQAKAALLGAGLLEQVEAYMALHDTPMVTKLAWTDTQDFERASPTVAGLSALLGLTSEQVDELFVTASSISA